MKLVEDKGGAVALMIAALIFLGTWPALLNLLERRGRNPVHTYLDYSFTNMLMAVVIVFTLGQIGDPQPGRPILSPNSLRSYTAPGRVANRGNRSCGASALRFVRTAVISTVQHTRLTHPLNFGSLLDRLLQNNGPSVGFALGGGIFLCLGNLAVQYALVR